MRRLLSLETKCYRKKGSTNPANIGRLLKSRHTKLRQQGMSSSRPNACVEWTVSVLLSRHQRFSPKPNGLLEARSPDKSGIFTDPHGAPAKCTFPWTSKMESRAITCCRRCCQIAGQPEELCRTWELAERLAEVSTQLSPTLPWNVSTPRGRWLEYSRNRTSPGNTTRHRKGASRKGTQETQTSAADASEIIQCRTHCALHRLNDFSAGVRSCAQH